MTYSKLLVRVLPIVFVAAGVCGCVSVGAPERVTVGSTRTPVASEAPRTRDHADARQKLAQAHAEIRSLRGKNADLRKDVRELKSEVDELDDRIDDLED